MPALMLLHMLKAVGEEGHMVLVYTPGLVQVLNKHISIITTETCDLRNTLLVTQQQLAEVLAR